MPLPAIIFGTAFALVVLAMVLVVVRSVRRSNRGEAAVEERGFQRLPDDSFQALAGWEGWPFARAIRPGGRIRDAVVGEHRGVRFMSLRWTQQEPDPGEGQTDSESYNIVAIAVEQDFPRLSVVRGNHKMGREQLTANVPEFEVGDGRFDRRWQTVGDPAFGQAVLTEQARATIDDLGSGFAFQPGWVTRVTPWRFWSGEDQMFEELEKAAAPWHHVPAEVWQRYGGAPRFLEVLGRGTPAG